jgi:hypothetical protein
MGLSQENLQMVLQAGVDAGTKIADELIAGGNGAVAKANMLQSQLKTAADSAAISAGSKFYQAGVDLAQQIYNGLAAKWAELQPKLGDMTLPQLKQTLQEAQTTVNNAVQASNTVASNPTAAAATPPVDPTPPPAPRLFIEPPSAAQLGVGAGKTRSQYIADFLSMVNEQFPSLKAKTLTQYFTKTGVPGMASKAAREARWDKWAKENGVPALAKGGIVMPRQGGTLALLGEKGRREAVVPLPNGGMLGGGGNTYQITIQGAYGMDMQKAGKELVAVLQDYERRNGRIPVKATR